MIHVLEHRPDPLKALFESRSILESDAGILMVEVPNANDFLISQLQCQLFIKFSL